MALFQKKPQVGSSVPLYTVGLEQTKLIVGLGNPAKEYDGTRHNIGFAVVDEFARKHDFPAWREQRDLKCLITTMHIGTVRTILIKPTTFMNLSGEAVQSAAHFYKVPTEDIALIHDELDIPFGQIRSRMGGGSAGHNGVKSVIQHMGEVTARLRIGIGPKVPEQIDSADFVLQKFTAEQATDVPLLLKEMMALLDEYLFSGQLPHETRTFVLV